METTALAVYIDLENLPPGVDFDRLMDMAASETARHVFAVKAVYGSTAALPKQYRQQLIDHNFQIVETPHIVKKKNRADLMISIDAFERFHLAGPPVDRYIFVTSDSDFSVIMDKLRGYGKEVWMIGPKADQAKKLLGRCCDLLLSIEDFIPPAPPPPPPAPTYDVEKDRLAQRLFKQALHQLGADGLPVDISAIGTQIKKLQKGFDLKRTRFKRLTDLAIYLEEEGVVRLGTNAKGARQIEIVDDSRPDHEEPTAGTATTKKISHESPSAILPNAKKKPKVSRKKAKAADSPSLFGEE